MTNQPYKVGDVIDVDFRGRAVKAEVVTYRTASRRQILTVRTENDGLLTLAIELPVTEGVASISVPPADIAAARVIALSILARHETRMPVAAEANLLASAVIALTGGAA